MSRVIISLYLLVNVTFSPYTLVKLVVISFLTILQADLLGPLPISNPLSWYDYCQFTIFVTSTHPGFRIWIMNPHELSFGLYRSNAIGGSH